MLMLMVDARKVRIRMAELEIPSLRALAARSGLHYNTVRDLMSGDSFHSETVDKLAVALGVSALDIMKIGERPDRPSESELAQLEMAA